MTKCLRCRSRNRNEAGLCEKLLGSDGLPILCVGPWASDKHYFLERFSHMFAVGMKNKWENRYYIDLFSGPGFCVNNEDGKEIPGSPMVAISKPFTDFVFVESNQDSLAALKRRIGRDSTGRRTEYVHGDANAKVDEVLDKMVHRRAALYFIFADPFNIQFKMATLKKLSSQHRLDALLHFPFGTYLRRVLSQSNLSEDTKEQIDQFLGNGEWRSLRESGFTAIQLLEIYKKQLQNLDYLVGDNFPNMKNRSNSSLYYLVFASKNRKGLEFWEKTCSIERDGQRKLPGL